MHKLLTQTRWQWISLFFFALIWSGVFILTKKGLVFFAPIHAAAIRIVCASISVLPIIIKHFKLYKWNNLKWLLGTAFLGNFFPVFIVCYAQTGMSSAMTGVLNSLMPCFAFIVGVVFFKSTIRWANILGLLIGVAGTMGLVLSAGSNLYSAGIWPVSLMLLSVFMHGININIIKHKLSELPAAAIVGGIFMIIGPLALLILFEEKVYAMHAQTGFWKAVGYLAFVGVVATNVALIGFNYLIKHTSAIFAASVTYIIPIFAIGWGVLDGEQFLGVQILFTFIILCGVYLVNKK